MFFLDKGFPNSELLEQGLHGWREGLAFARITRLGLVNEGDGQERRVLPQRECSGSAGRSSTENHNIVAGSFCWLGQQNLSRNAAAPKVANSPDRPGARRSMSRPRPRGPLRRCHLNEEWCARWSRPWPSSDLCRWARDESGNLRNRKSIPRHRRRPCLETAP